MKTVAHLLGGLLLLTSLSTRGETSRGIKVSIPSAEGVPLELYRNSHALIVANSAYRNGWDPLPGAARDARDVAAALTRHGFEVTLKVNLTREQFNTEFSEFAMRNGREENSRLLFYYSGHGYTQAMATEEQLGYLVMIDAPLPTRDEVGFDVRSVDLQSLVTQAKKIRSRHVLFLLDACFTGSILNFRELVVPAAISDDVRHPVRQFITAGRANEPVPDHSIFKQVFLDALEGREREPIPDGYLTGSELGLLLKTRVPDYNPAQHPQYGKILDPRLDKGDFVFLVAPPEVQKPPDLPARAYLRFVVSPSTAAILLDGRRVTNLDPLSRLEIAPDSLHEVRLEQQGYSTYIGHYRVPPGATGDVTATLAPVPPPTPQIAPSGNARSKDGRVPPPATKVPVPPLW